MDIRTLKYFLAVVREENISRAAETLNVTQPTLTRQMQQLETELGTKLFVRGKRLALTDGGLLLRHRAEEVVAMLEKLEQDFSGDRELAGSISIGSGGLASFRVLAAAMKEFRRLHPKVQFNVHMNSANFVKNQLEQGLLDFGLLLEPAEYSSFDFLRMDARERWGLFMARSHRLAGREFIVREDISGLKLLVASRLPVQKELESWLGCKMSRLDIFAAVNMITNATALLEDGDIAGLTLESAVELFDRERFTFVPLKPAILMTSVFVWKRFQPTMGAAGRFLAFFKNYCGVRVGRS